MTIHLLTTPQLQLFRLRLLYAVIVCALLGGCASPGQQQPQFQPPSLIAASVAETAQDAFNSCKQDALALDASARKQQSSAQYLMAARTLNQCLLEVDSHRRDIPIEERMKMHALTVLNYLKGGDVVQARVQLTAFEMTYPNNDLYFGDYTSFVDSFRVLLNDSAARVTHGNLLNVNPILKSEHNRRRYWLTH